MSIINKSMVCHLVIEDLYFLCASAVKNLFRSQMKIYNPLALVHADPIKTINPFYASIGCYFVALA